MRRVAAAAALLALTGCNGSEEPRTKSCDGLLKPASADAALPAGIPAGVEGAVFYEVRKAGATALYYAHLEADDIVAVRDTVAAAFARAGHTIDSRDEEPPAEAEFQFTTPTSDGSVRVTPLCAGTVTIRWRVGPR